MGDYWPFDEAEPGERVTDLGHDHWLTYYGWGPDRALNPKYAGLPDIEKYGAIVWHKRADGSRCSGGIGFDTPEVRAVAAVSGDTGAKWTVEQWEPLTISPSVLCKAPLVPGDPSAGECGDHGFIREGRWVVA